MPRTPRISQIASFSLLLLLLQGILLDLQLQRLLCHVQGTESRFSRNDRGDGRYDAEYDGQYENDQRGPECV